jgi:dTDP-4-dehydrorhamnose 3,5-epimerase
LQINELSIAGCFIYSPDIYKDDRGQFFEWFQSTVFAEFLDEDFKLAQANCSISQRGVVRGVHFTQKAPGQSKLVTVFNGKVFDVLVDLRKSSSTFGKWEAVTLDSRNPQTLYIPWGIGHAFMALEDNTVFAYLCDKKYDPQNEFDLNALDPQIGIEWPQGFEILRSKKDSDAPLFNSIYEILPE